MNKFKYQNKTETSKEVMDSFKDFDKVLNKHYTISSAYKAIWKYVFIATSSAGICIGIFFLFQKSNKNIKPNITLNASIQKPTKDIVKVKDFERPKNEPIKAIAVKSVTKKTNSIKQEKEEELKSPKEEHKTSILDTVFYQKETPLETWYTLNQKPEKEIIKLPTLFVSNLPWPSKIDKNKLVKTPNIIAVYKSINREIPIVNGMAYVTTTTAIKKPVGFKLSGNVFPPGLIREIHKVNDSCILLLKDIEMYIPGRGRVNVGDRKIEISLKNKNPRNL